MWHPWIEIPNKGPVAQLYILESLEKLGCMKYLYNKFEAFLLSNNILFKINNNKINWTLRMFLR